MIFRHDSLSREENYTTASCSQSGRRKDTEKKHTEDTTPTEFSMAISINNYYFCFFFLRIFIIKIISGRRKWGDCREMNLEFLFLFFLSGICRLVRLGFIGGNDFNQPSFSRMNCMTRNCCSP